MTMHVHVSQSNFHNLHGSSASWYLHGLEKEMYRNPRSTGIAAVKLVSQFEGQISVFVSIDGLFH